MNMLDVLNLIVDWLTLVAGVAAAALGMVGWMNGTLENYMSVILVMAGCFALTIWHKR